MNRTIFATVILGLFSVPSSPAAKPETIAESTEQHDARMAWWREARFGMFVHWGVYSHLGGDWQGKPVRATPSIFSAC